MSLPFSLKEHPKPIELKSVYGVEGSVYVRPWTLDEFEALQPTLEGIKSDADGIQTIKRIVADVIVNPDGSPCGAKPEDFHAYPTPTLADLLTQISSRCGLAKPEDIEKN
jgi:hypothetical protein